MGPLPKPVLSLVCFWSLFLGSTCPVVLPEPLAVQVVESAPVGISSGVNVEVEFAHQ